MTQWHFFILFFLSCSLKLFGQIELFEKGNIDTYVLEDLAGPGVTVTNISLKGFKTQINAFSQSNTQLGFESGLFICAGLAHICQTYSGDASAGNINTNQAASSNFVNNSSYDLLEQLASQSVRDPVAIEFDFVAQGDIIKLDYIFASEEYPEFNCTSAPDVMGIFIDGPGFDGFTNIATIPGTDIPVGVNTVNDGNIGAEDGDIIFCQEPFGSTDFTDFFINNRNEPWLEFDGITKALSAEAQIIPCEKYRMVIAVADVSDHLYDSGVFLKAKSLRSNSLIVKAAHESNSGIMYEGCSVVEVAFSLQNPLSVPYTIQTRLLGSAIAGVDYFTDVPSSLVFEPGETRKAFIISSFEDFIKEGEEEIKIRYQLPECLLVDSISWTLKDDGILSTEQEIFFIEEVPQDYQMGISANGIPGNYRWEPTEGVSDPNINSPIITIDEPREYKVIFDNDECLDTLLIQFVDSPKELIYVPNIFSPNNDGINDMITLSSDPSFEWQYEFMLVNRQGRTVYTSSGELHGTVDTWDGFYKDQIAEQGVYIYSLVYWKSIFDKKTQLGDVFLMRKD